MTGSRNMRQFLNHPDAKQKRIASLITRVLSLLKELKVFIGL